MNTNIFVPTKINVGFQERKDTYTGKLAYVIYFDEKVNYEKRLHGKVGEMKIFQMKSMIMSQWKDLY